MTDRLEFLVDRQDLKRSEWRHAAARDLRSGEILLANKRFAFTSNNITYALVGPAVGYWQFFPAPEPWGSIPVWGIGQVVGSRHPDIAEGENIYGYYPMSSHLIVAPDKLSATRFLDASAHRAKLPPTYNEYIRIDHDPAYDKSLADAHLVLRPLFSVGFFLTHFLVDADFFGARDIIISSASSKTALMLAFLLKRSAAERIRIIGLTNAINKSFVEASHNYDLVFAYDALPADTIGPAVYLDIAGNPRVRAAMHHQLSDRLRYCSVIGFTHVVPPDPAQTLPGPKPEFFFAPTHILARREAWGADELRRRVGAEWQAAVANASEWLTIDHSAGPEAIEQVYGQVLGGQRAPDRADILAFEK